MDANTLGYLVLAFGAAVFVAVSYLRNPEEVSEVVHDFLDPDES